MANPAAAAMPRIFFWSDQVALQLTASGADAVLTAPDTISRSGTMKRPCREASAAGHRLVRAAVGTLTTFQIKISPNFRYGLAGQSGQRSRI